MIEILKKLEPQFFAAGQMALRLQKSIKLQKKSDTGNDWADAVTVADFLIQEYLLKEMSKTALIKCRLLAEEKTPLVKNFNPDGKLFLNIDPIDGSLVYAKKKPFFSIIVGLHDGKNLLYTFKYHPALAWTHIITKGSYKQIGKTPKINLSSKSKKIITYIREPKQIIPELNNELIRQGYKFIPRQNLIELIGGTSLLLAGKISGLFQTNPNAYDGLVALHFGQAKNYKIYQGPNNKFDISDTKKTKYGEFYPGWYLVLKQ